MARGIVNASLSSGNPVRRPKQAEREKVGRSAAGAESVGTRSTQKQFVVEIDIKREARAERVDEHDKSLGVKVSGGGGPRECDFKQVACGVGGEVVIGSEEGRSEETGDNGSFAGGRGKESDAEDGESRSEDLFESDLEDEIVAVDVAAANVSHFE